MERRFGLVEGETRPWVDRGFKVLLVVVAGVVIVALLWMVFGSKTDPCKGAPAGAVVEDPDNPGTTDPSAEHVAGNLLHPLRALLAKERSQGR